MTCGLGEGSEDWVRVGSAAIARVISHLFLGQEDDREEQGQGITRHARSVRPVVSTNTLSQEDLEITSTTRSSPSQTGTLLVDVSACQCVNQTACLREDLEVNTQRQIACGLTPRRPGR